METNIKTMLIAGLFCMAFSVCYIIGSRRASLPDAAHLDSGATNRAGNGAAEIPAWHPDNGRAN